MAKQLLAENPRTDYKGGKLINELVEKGCVLFRHITPKRRHYRNPDRPMSVMIFRDASKEQYPDLAFNHPDLYSKGIAPNKKIEVAAAYLLTGTFKDTAEMTGVSIHEVRKAKKTDWFKHVYGALVEERGEELKAQCSNVIGLGMKNLTECIRSGEEKVVRNGEIIRVKISARDSAYVIDAMMAKKSSIDESENRQATEESALSILAKIAEAFVDVSKENRLRDARPPSVKTTDSDIEDAVIIEQSPTDAVEKI